MASERKGLLGYYRQFEGLSEEETRKWMAEFGDLKDDRSLRAAFESFDFEE